MNSFLLGLLLRLGQTWIDAAPWLAAGFVIAGVFEVMIGPQRIQRMFGGQGPLSLLLGWCWGMLLPVCSLGVIPVVATLYRNGVRGGALFAFALTAPLFNPLSVLYGLTLSDPVAIITFGFCSLIIVTLGGLVWDRFFTAPPADDAQSEPDIEYGIRRIVAVARTSTEMIFSPTSLWVIIGMLGSASVSSILPHGIMSSMLERDNPLAPVLVAATGVPLYSTPLSAMSQIGSIFQHGNSVGAAFSLLIFVAGFNLGLVFCLERFMGWRSVLTFFAVLAVITLGLSWIISEPLYPKGVEVAGHTHAFDSYTNPFPTPDMAQWQTVARELEKHWGNQELGGSLILAFMMLTGAVFLILDRSTGLDNWITARSSGERKDRDLPTPVIASLSVAGLVAASILGCYVYYPPVNEALDEMTAFNVEAVGAARAENWEGALKWIQFLEDLSRRLEVGSFIRSGELSEYHRTKARIYRESLELLKHEVEDQDAERAGELALQTHLSFRRLKRAFKSDGTE